jgi:transposase
MRYLLGSPRVVHPPSEAVGIDDWAFRRGHQYGTIIVDLHRHEVIELLEDREATSVFAWLKRHPEIRLIARDRGGAYAEAAAKGAPQAVQVADRWHLLSRTPRRQSNALSSVITPLSGKQPRGSCKRSESRPL